MSHIAFNITIRYFSMSTLNMFTFCLLQFAINLMVFYTPTIFVQINSIEINIKIVPQLLTIKAKDCAKAKLKQKISSEKKKRSRFTGERKKKQKTSKEEKKGRRV